jgi:hypothetical protein
MDRLREMSLNLMLQCAIVVLQYTNRGPTPRATARVALRVYPPPARDPVKSIRLSYIYIYI